MALPPRTEPVDINFRNLVATRAPDEQYELEERAAIKQYEGNVSQRDAEMQTVYESRSSQQKRVT